MCCKLGVKAYLTLLTLYSQHKIFLCPGFAMATFPFLLLLPYVLSISLAAEDELIVTTKSGQVQGKLLPVLDGEVRAFLGIPYAKPPEENLRFRTPQPADPWQGVKDATNYANTCFQLPDTTFPGRIIRILSQHHNILQSLTTTCHHTI